MYTPSKRRTARAPASRLGGVAKAFLYQPTPATV